MYRKKILFFIFFSFTLLNLPSQNSIISGFVTDKATGERLIGVSIYDSIRLKGTVSNNFGFFSLSTPASDTVYLIAYMIGYKNYKVKITANVNQSINIELLAKAENLKEVIVSGEQAIENKTGMSTLEIPIKQIKRLPTFMGETDILKAFQLMPGVQSGKEGSSALYVRGGGPDQNLILLDDIPLYYVSHLGGFISIFDANVINNVKLIKGGFPARYGGRLSSVIDIRMKDGNENKVHGEFAIGTLVSKLSLEGPLSQKTTYVISFRRSFIDLFTRAFSLIRTNGEQSYWYNLYDANFKICNRISDKDRIFLSFYSGSDKVVAKEKYDNSAFQNEESINYKGIIKWGNILTSMRWNHIYRSNLFSNVTIGYTRFKYETDISGKTIEKSSNTVLKNVNTNFFSGINDILQKVDFDYYPNEKHKIKFGNASTLHFFNPSISSYKETGKGGTSIDTSIGKNGRLQSYEFSIYGEDEFTVSRDITLNMGLHVSSYLVSGRTFFSVQPRISGNYKLRKHSAVKASFVTMQQPLHLLSNSGGGFPTDLWVPATEKVLPEQSLQGALGIVRTISPEKYVIELSIEGYYKTLKNLIEFQEGASFFSSSQNWEDKVVTGGKGQVYGIEVLIHKKEGKLAGWIGYTLSKNIRQFEELNGGKSFPYRFDRRHDISVVSTYELNEKIVFSCSWVYGTGNAITLATDKYSIKNYNYNYLGTNTSFITYEDAHIYTSRNGYRMPAYHKLDVGVNFIKNLKKAVRTWNISIYNVYNRQNAYLLFFKTKDNQTKLYQLSLFPIIPSVSYQYKF